MTGGGGAGAGWVVGLDDSGDKRGGMTGGESDATGRLFDDDDKLNTSLGSRPLAVGDLPKFEIYES